MFSEDQGRLGTLGIAWLLFLGQQLQAQDRPIEVQQRLEHSNALRIDSQPLSAAGRDIELFVLDKGSWSRTRNHAVHQEEEKASWSLGHGKGHEAFAEISFAHKGSRRLGAHLLSVNLAADGSLLHDTNASNTLEDQYVTADPNRSDLSRLRSTQTRTKQWGGLVGIADRIRLDPTSSFEARTDIRYDRSQNDGVRYDRSQLQTWGLSLEKQLARWRLSSAFNQSLLKSLQELPVLTPTLLANVVQANPTQTVTDLSAQVVAPLGRGVDMGLGYKVVRSKFSAVNTLNAQGPTVSFARKLDGQFSVEGQLAFLQETATARQAKQISGNSSLTYNLSAVSKLNLSLKKDFNLLAAFRSATDNRTTPLSQQQFASEGAVSWDYLSHRTRFKLGINQSVQVYSGLKIEQRQLSVDVVRQISRLSEWGQTFAWSFHREREALLRDDQRQFIAITTSYRERWSTGLRWLGMQPFWSLGASYENLAPSDRPLRFQRLTLLAGVGQQWYL